MGIQIKIFDFSTRSILFSIFFHLIFFSLLFTTQILMPETSMLSLKEKFKSEPFEPTVQVDLLALPDEKIPETRVVDPEAKIVESKTEAKTKDSMVVSEQTKKEVNKKKITEEQNKVLNQLKEEQERDKALESLAQESIKTRTPVKGNILSKGAANRGAIGTPMDQYKSLLVSAIKENFDIFMWHSNKQLSAQVFLQILPSGRILTRHILEGSGQKDYDLSVLRAIDRTKIPISDNIETRQTLSKGIVIEIKADEK